ncbi:MAG: exodeoxyribonuclease III [Bacteroidales bacterium]|jgi:exodeoxyribonuclease-3|nr:exodeoxyribonuclease III [Bacteroidales bacterium]
MKIVSWNINGIRAIIKKDFAGIIQEMDPDILCLQETKAQDEQVSETLEGIDNYNVFSNSAHRPGYSGTAVMAKKEPLDINMGIGMKDFDDEGRVISLEYDDFYLINVYVPNSGSELKRLSYRQEWDKVFFNYLKEKERKKPLIVCGDFNVAHREIDLARPKQNYNKSAGFMQEEIDGMDRYTGDFIDTFRHFHPGRKDAYSWWSYRANARGKNVGWRIDYFLVSKALVTSIRKADILNEIMGSDHCPVTLEL